MTPLKGLVVAASVAIGLLTVCEPIDAHGRYGYRHGPSVNFSFGYWGGPGYWGPGWGPGWGYWGPPAVVYAPSIIVPQEPRVWVEGEQAPAAAQLPAPHAPSNDANAQQWWYWCASSRSYYPYVSTCAEGWQRVAPQPAAGAR